MHTNQPKEQYEKFLEQNHGSDRYFNGHNGGRNPAFQAQLSAEGSTVLGSFSQKAAVYLRAEQAEWANLIRAANIKLD
jgi:hypothetical protein